MRKYPNHIENPIDDIMIYLCEILAPIFKCMHFTPNMLTTVSLLFGLLTSYTYYKKQFVLSGLYFAISYFFDCFDGNYAREYKMVSNFGDYYEHIKDVVLFTIVICQIINTYIRMKSNIKFLPILMIFFVVTSTSHVACQEVYNDDGKKKQDGGNFLKNVMNFCPAKTKQDAGNILKYLKYGGPGTLTLFTVILILLSNYE